MSKTPNTKHNEYIKHQSQIRITNAIYDGVDTAKEYLYKYAEEDAQDFKDRQNTADLDNYVKTTADAIKNIIFRKPIDIGGIQNTTILSYLDRIDLKQSINEFAKETLLNRVRDGYSYILIDSVSYDSEVVKTKAQQIELGIRPYFVNVKRANVTNWKMGTDYQYEMMIITESYEVWDGFSSEIKEQIRVLYSDGTVQIWRDEELFNTIDTKMNKIPIIQIGSDLVPPLYNMAKTNINLFNRESEKENYVRIGANPFLAVFGDLESEDDDQPTTLSISEGMKFGNKSESDVKWTEMSGANYEIIKDCISEHRAKMQRTSVEFTTETNNKTATEVEKASTTAEALLTNYATEVEEGINKAIQTLSDYDTTLVTKDEVITVNKDFESNVISEKQFNMLMQLYTNELISKERILRASERGELLDILTDEELIKESLLLKDGNVTDLQ